MLCRPTMLAFLPSIGFQEMFILLVIGLLLYGRNLPEAGRTLGKAVAHLRRGFQEFKDQLDRDGDLKDVKKSFQDSAKELRNIGQVGRAIADPRRALQDAADEHLAAPFRDLTDSSLSSPLPEELLAEETQPEESAPGKTTPDESQNAAAPESDAVTSSKDPS